MAWKQLRDFDGTIKNHKMTVRVTKSDDSVTPKYSVAIGTRNDPNPFRPFLRGDILNMRANGSFASGVAVEDIQGATVLVSLLNEAAKFIAEDTETHNLELKKSEEARIAALNGKRQGDPKANTGLSRFKSKYKTENT